MKVDCLSILGAVELDDLPLKKDALRRLDLPLAVKSGIYDAVYPLQ